MWNGKTVSVILPTLNEKDSIRACITEFFESGVVDEVVVVNNNAVAGTSEEVAKTAAREVFESRQGYGRAIRTGLQEATGDYLVLSEPDGTFTGHDVLKLVAYARDFDYVLGTRTTREMIWQGANMGFALKWGNWVVGKMAEFLFNSSILTDCGCTMRLISRPAYERIRPYFTRTGNAFGLEMTLLVISRKVSFMEIPVNYRKRVGASAVTGSLRKAIALGFRMVWMVWMFRLGLAGKKPAGENSEG
ncbi:MAG: glycosyltransferase family 2 protein [Phycisphaerae bacterium]|nr:glycosyltransferase family 2 protein [Phycisphaerae bacterium]